MTLNERVNILLSSPPDSHGAKRLAIRAKVGAAAESSSRIAKLAVEARSELEEVWVNGHGALAEPYTTRDEIMRARKKLDAALEILDEARWPTSADYDVLD